MRPRLEIRSALSQSVATLEPAMGEFTFKDLAVHAQVGFKAARKTVHNMADAGELVPVGFKRDPGSKRPLRTYRPNKSRSDGMQTLTGAISGWVTSF